MLFDRVFEDAEVIERKDFVVEVRRKDGSPRLVVYPKIDREGWSPALFMTVADLHLQPIVEEIAGKDSLTSGESIPVVVLVPSGPTNSVLGIVTSGLTSVITSFACANIHTKVDVVALKIDIDHIDSNSLRKAVQFLQDTPRAAAVMHGGWVDLGRPKLNMELQKSSKAVYSLVTGGARGIGEHISRELAKQGRNIIVTARPGGTLGESFAASLHDTYNIEAFFMPLDLSDHDSIRKIAHDLSERGVVLDVIVHNAAVGTKTASYQTTETRNLSEVLVHVNSVGPVVLQDELMSRKGLLRSGEEGGCAVLAISSVGALRPFAEMQPIDLASKAMMNTWADQLNRSHPELQVMVLAPGATDTDMLQQSVLNAVKQAGKLDTFTSLLPKGMLIQPQDLGVIAAFLCDEDISRLAHGSMVSACCGLHLDFNGLPHID